jgi:hypothetical protein
VPLAVWHECRESGGPELDPALKPLLRGGIVSPSGSSTGSGATCATSPMAFAGGASVFQGADWSRASIDSTTRTGKFMFGIDFRHVLTAPPNAERRTPGASPIFELDRAGHWRHDLRSDSP